LSELRSRTRATNINRHKIKLLFDHNLSPRLVNRLEGIYPNSQHLFNLTLDTAEDSVVWQYAREHEFMIVTKDSDFSELSLLKGFPPKVIWIRTGNCTTNDIESLIRSNAEKINEFGRKSSLGILILS
jgi:predicted nuclease of predicted toxin-antitoxin system